MWIYFVQFGRNSLPSAGRLRPGSRSGRRGEKRPAGGEAAPVRGAVPRAPGDSARQRDSVCKNLPALSGCPEPGPALQPLPIPPPLLPLLFSLFFALAPFPRPQRRSRSGAARPGAPRWAAPSRPAGAEPWGGTRGPGSATRCRRSSSSLSSCRLDLPSLPPSPSPGKVINLQSH